jgi:hypothetical protein
VQTRAHHELKTWPKYFAAIRSGAKKFEIRRNDRDFAIGDTLILQEFDPDLDAYTGQVETRMISFLLTEEGLGVIHGYVAIGFGSAPAQEALEAVQDGEDVSAEAVARWHAVSAANATLRAQDARKVAEGYRSPGEGRPPMSVAADRHDAVAASAEAEARFHAAAARIWEGFV